MTNLRARKNLIALDGLDGTGKSSGLRVVENYLKESFPDTKLNLAEGWSFNDFCADVRAVTMKHKNNVSHNVLYNLFRAIWTDAWEKHGYMVGLGKEFLLTDRWLLSTGVYQDIDDSKTSNLISATNAVPGLTILLTASADVALTRIEATRKLDDFEKEYFQVHPKLQDRFIKKLPDFTGESVIIDTDTLTQEEVAVKIKLALDKYFGK